MAGCVRWEVRVDGAVQGVGFRPFVHGLASRLGLAGRVGNDSGGVFIDIEGPQPLVEEFLRALERDAPPLAAIERLSASPAEPTGVTGFAIVTSDTSGPPRALVAADTAPCVDCLRELDDPADRRFGYPFVNCTNCGPRFTIVRGVPYDRPLTTMAGFVMCAACAAEYHDPADRRFHAQPTCCPDCGPRLRLVDRAGHDLPGDPTGLTVQGGPIAQGGPRTSAGPIAQAAALLRAGRVLAVKGLGGYHLAVSADDEVAASALRSRKHREDKPFAVMVPDLAAARLLCEVDGTAQALLASRRRPIVLLPRRPDAPVAPSVAPANRQLGLMLPYTPLHHLLLRAVGRPIVLTSGNVSDEPIAYLDEDALARLGGIADAFLTHDRPIHIRTDDSVVRPFAGRETVLRRSRGYVPEPVRLRWPATRPVLACGAELKNTFCLVQGGRAFVSQHIGDLENYQTLRSYTEGIEHFGRLFGIRPEVVAHDLHPEYLSTKYALELPEVELIGVQHHHAHIASCLADNGEAGPVLGVAFDGLGYGADGTLWGGEFLLADLAGYRRLGHLAPVPMPGGTAAIREPWRMAVAYLDAAFGADPPQRLAVLRRNAARLAAVRSLVAAGVNSPLTSSAGRLFDAVSALLGLRDAISYEGQAAIELEQHADPHERGAYPAHIDGAPQVGVPQAGVPQVSVPQVSVPQAGVPQVGVPQAGTADGAAPLQVAGADLVLAAASDLLRGTAPPVVAARFHNGVSDLIVATCRRLRASTGVAAVALSGGVFQNLLLLRRTADHLAADGFRVLTHSRVPTNDGGISLGQAAVAVARTGAGSEPAAGGSEPGAGLP